MKQLMLIIVELKIVIKESFKELTILGKFTLGPIILVIFIITVISIITIGYPLILINQKYGNQKRSGINLIKSIFYRCK